MIRFAALAFLGLALVAAEDRKAGSIEGNVTFDGKRVAKGKVSFHPAAGKAVTAEIKAGAFSAPAVPAGELRITVEGKGIPPKYGDKAASGLAFTAKSGKQKFDIALTK